MTAATDRSTALTAAMTAAATAIAFQVAGRATRDALFLASHPVTELPGMMILTAVLAVPVILFATYAMGRATPARAVPAGFAASAVVITGIWAFSARFESAAAVILFLYVGATGPVLVSGFWTAVNERFDPRYAKRHIGRIGAFGILGGFVGGVVANRIAAAGFSGLMLPLLALLHAAAAFATRGIGAAPGTQEPAEEVAKEGEEKSESEIARFSELYAGLSILRRVPYLRHLAALVVLSVVAESLLDYIFKQQATIRFQGTDDLLNLFSAFQAGVSLAAFGLQTWVSRRMLERGGIGRSVALLPTAIAAGGLGVLFAPGLVAATLARAGDAVIRNSLFRSGYELFFSPVTPEDKRGTKAIVDVGGARLGDALGGGLVFALLALGPAASTALPAAAVVVAIGCLTIVWSLTRGYVKALEARLIHGAGRIGADAAAAPEAKPMPVVGLDQTHTIDVAELRAHLMAAGEAGAAEELSRSAITGLEAPVAGPRLPPAVSAYAHRVADLRAPDPGRVRRALHTGPIGADIVPHVIPLLDHEDVAAEVVAMLQAEMPGITGQLTDFLIDPLQPIQVRRRIPRILATVPGWRAVQALFVGLEDRRFEVRVQSGRALAKLHERAPEQGIERERVFAAVRREVAVERRIWEGQRDIDLLEGEALSPFQDEYLRRRASASLEHVFTLLSLALPAQPLRLAFQGLHTSDEMLRGMALEYLESVLPPDVRRKLWPFLEQTEHPAHPQRDREEILKDLLRSNESIRINLAELKKLQEDG